MKSAEEREEETEIERDRCREKRSMYADALHVATV